MPLSPSGQFVSVSSVGFTPTGGSLISLTNVQNVTVNPNASDISEGGDGSLYNTAGGVVQIDWSVSLELLNAAQLDAVIPGTYGVLTWTERDSRNGAVTAGGALIKTLSNCYYMGAQKTNAYRQFTKAAPTFKSLSSDGATSPLSSAAA